MGRGETSPTAQGKLAASRRHFRRCLDAREAVPEAAAKRHEGVRMHDAGTIAHGLSFSAACRYAASDNLLQASGGDRLSPRATCASTTVPGVYPQLTPRRAYCSGHSHIPRYSGC